MKSIIALSLLVLGSVTALADVPRKLTLYRCVNEINASDSLPMSASRVMAPRRLADTIVNLNGVEFYASGEYQPEGYVFPASDYRIKTTIFVPWAIMRGQDGKIVVNPWTPMSKTYVCKAYGAQG